MSGYYAKELSAKQRAELEQGFHTEQTLTDRFGGLLCVLMKADADERRILIDNTQKTGRRIVKRYRDGESTWSIAESDARDLALALERREADLPNSDHVRAKFRI